MANSSTNQGGIHSFLGRLNIAEKIVSETSKGKPKLWHAIATSSSGKPVDDVWGLDNIDGTFIVNDKHVYVMKETNWAKFETPIEKGEFEGDVSKVGLISIPLPIGAAEAEHSMRELTKSTAQIKSVELAWRFTRFTSDQPYYFFSMTDGTQHAVGAENGKMATED